MSSAHISASKGDSKGGTRVHVAHIVHAAAAVMVAVIVVHITVVHHGVVHDRVRA